MATVRVTSILLTLVFAIYPCGNAIAAEDTLSFSAAQAAQGKRNYLRYCAGCHGENLEGMHLSPSLVGARFDQSWRGKSAENLAFHIWRMPNLPIAKPGSLGDDLYANIFAYILESNGFEAGEYPLPDRMDRLAKLTIPALEGAHHDPLAPAIEDPSQSDLLMNLPAVTSEMLSNPAPEDWIQWGRTQDGLSYSPLDQLTPENVSGLRAAWRIPLVDGENMPAPLVHQGVMFLHTYPDTVLAIDATNGAILWRYQREGLRRSTKRNGLSLYGDRVFLGTSDLHMIALNAKTGELEWDHEVRTETAAAMRVRYSLRSAPLVAGDKLVQGVTGSGAPKGAFIFALDINTGEEVWRFNTIARPGEPGGNTWAGLPLEKRSGGSVWNQGTYDPELNLVYFGVAPTYDTGPLLHPTDKEGHSNDAMYTNCTVALDADTGELVWHYQHVANDQWDLDWSFERQIVDVPADGGSRKAVVTVGKMAILEALDAATGEYLFSVDTGVQNVITAIDPNTGAKTIDPDQLPDPEDECVICPSAFGARSWPPTAYSPQTQYFYIPLIEWCMGMGPTGFRLLSSGVGLTSEPHPTLLEDRMIGRVQAVNIATRELAWTHDLETPPSTAVLATAGGLVFVGDVEPSFKALDSETGKLLWRAPLNDLPSSSVITYSAGGKQYVTIVAGLTNNHINDISRSYYEFARSLGDEEAHDPNGGAAVWTFALE